MKQLKLLQDDIRSTQVKYPGLTIMSRDGKPIALVGNFQINDPNGKLQGSWDIRVEIPRNYPYGFPSLFEVSEKIIRSDDTHMGDNGKACVELDVIERAIARKGITLLSFFDKYVFKYFCWSLLYANGESEGLESWGHNNEGHKELIYKFLNTREEATIQKWIDLMSSNSLPRRNSSCFCGSHLKYKNCHESGVIELNKLQLNISEVKKYFEK